MVNLSDIIAPAFYDAWWRLEEARGLEYWFRGGRGSTKSSFVSIFIPYLLVSDPDANAVVFRKHKVDIRSSVLEQLVWGIGRLGWMDYFDVSVSPAQITYRPTGQKIIFRGLDDPKKMKSIKTARGCFKAVWFEELDEFDGYPEVHSVIESTARGGSGFRMICTYNPPESSANWVNVEAARGNSDRYVHTSDYRTVPKEWLGPDFLREAERMERERPDVYRHTYLGEVTGTGAEIFVNLQARPITSDEIGRFQTVRYGMDFGFANDPTAIVSAAYDRARRTVYVFGEWWKKGAFNDDIYLNGIEKRGLKKKPINGDSEDPGKIAELNRLGAHVLRAYKGRGSVDRGIDWLRRCTRIIIDPARCPNVWREMSRYEYIRMRDGELRAEYPDRDNHTIDALRYALEEFINEGRGSRLV